MASPSSDSDSDKCDTDSDSYDTVDEEMNNQALNVGKKRKRYDTLQGRKLRKRRRNAAQSYINIKGKTVRHLAFVLISIIIIFK